MFTYNLKSAVLFLICLCNISFVFCDEECDDDHKCHRDSKCVKVTLGHNNYNLCICNPGFTGWDCSTPLDYCNKHCRPLQRGISCKHTLCNQGQCINQDAHPYYRCDCGAFYKGDNCEIEDNPCSYERNNPCGNGDCEFIPGVNQINCKCHPGWTKNSNQPNTKYTWNGVEVHMTPACLEEVKKGITGSAPILGPRDPTMVNKDRIDRLRFELASRRNVQNEIFTTGLENISFIVKTFEQSDSNGSESTRTTESNEHQYLDEFEESYFSLVRNKMNLLEDKSNGGSQNKNNGTRQMCSILKDAWIAELEYPVDLPLFKKILTNAVYKLYPHSRAFASEKGSKSLLNHRTDSNKLNSNSNYKRVTQNGFNKNLSSRGSDANINSVQKDMNDNKNSVNNSSSIFILGQNASRTKHKRSTHRRISRRSFTRFYKSTNFLNRHVRERRSRPLVEYRYVERREDERYEQTNFVNDGISYLKSEQFNTILTHCPYFSGPKVNNPQVATQKARVIIDRLIKNAQTLKSKSSQDGLEHTEAKSARNEPDEMASDFIDVPNYYEQVDHHYRLFRGRRRKKRLLFTTKPRYLRKRSRHKTRRAFLQKLSGLVDRITSKYINRMKCEAVCNKLSPSTPELNDYITGKYGWKYDPYYFNCQGRTKGHGLYLSGGCFSNYRHLETLLRDPFKIPAVSTHRISHREIVKRMLQEF